MRRQYNAAKNSRLLDNAGVKNVLKLNNLEIE